MKKNEKFIIDVKSRSFSDGLAGAIRAADENDLRVLLALMLTDDGEGVDYADILRSLELTESEFDASVKYWRGAGLIKKSKNTAKENDGEKKAEPPAVSSAHRGGKLERKSELPSYSTTELSELIEKRQITAEFINEAQRVVGKIFNTHEVNILVGMVDYIGFDEASVIIILSHMVKMGKRSLRYAEQIAFSLYDEGVTDIGTLQARLCKMEDNSKVESAVRSMFGMTGRSLTAKEKKFLKSWIDTMGYDEECIRLAYDITVDATHSPAPAYANSILENWYAAGLHTRDDIIAAEAARKEEKAVRGAKTEGSFDTDDFFDAALKRSFSDL